LERWCNWQSIKGQHMNNYRNFVARLPRHAADSSNPIRVEVRRCGPSQASCAALLVDFSRQGARLQLKDAFEVGERLLIQIEAGPDFVYRQEATIRWRTDDSPSAVLYGCSFDSPVEWEVLGELLMRGVLSTD
jgi:hypothetical protein